MTITSETSPSASTRPEGPWMRWVLYPVLLAPYPAWKLWADNIGHAAPRDVVAIIMGIAFVAALLTFLPARWTDVRRSGLVATVLLLWFGMPGLLVPGRVDASTVLVGWGAVLVVGLAVATTLSARWLGGVTAMLNSVGVVLLLLNVSAIATHVAAGDDPAMPGAAEPLPIGAAPGGGQAQPDVFLIVPDRYGRADLMAQQWGLDTSAFLDGLDDRGFRVVEDAWARYSNTDMSLASAWSLRPLDESGRSAAELSDAALAVLREPPIGDLFAAAGYEYVHLGSWTRPTASARNADRVLTLQDSNEFAAAWEGITILPPVWEALGSGVRSLMWQRQLAHARHQIDTLHELAREDADRPRFVVAHVLLPHPPYVFHADGRVREYRRNEYVDALDAYREQVDFLDDQLLAWIDVLDRQAPGSVVAVVADEGPYPRAWPVGDPALYDWEAMTPEDEQMKMGILAAVRLGDGAPEELGRTPTAIMRTLVNHVLDTDLEPVPERAFRRGGPRGRELVELTDQLGLS